MKCKYSKGQILELRKSKTITEIAATCGVSKQRIQQIIGKTGRMFSKYSPPAGMSRCYTCKTFQPIDQFTNELPHRCKKCVSERWTFFLKKYDYTKEHRKGGKWYEKDKARQAVYRAIKKGGLKRQPCKIGKDCSGRVEAHHYLGYEKEHWLDVEWLCFKHHKIETVRKNN